MKEKIWQWFVEPLDPQANQWIAFELAKDIEVNLNRLADKNHKMHDLYQLRAYSDVSMIKKGASQFGWKVVFWKRKGPLAIIEQWIFPKKKLNLKLKKKV